MFSADQLAAICPRCPDPGTVSAALNNAMTEFGVTDHAMFVAQLAHESGEFRYVREIASGLAYEGRKDLGNDEEGDGRRYKGRGYLQITGKANYRECGAALGLDLVAHPELLELPVLAARSAGWFWQSRKLNGLSLTACTRRINGGLNGLDQRRAYYLKAREVLGLQDPAPVEEQGFMASEHRGAAQPALLVTAALVPLIYIVVCAVLFRDGFTDEMRAMVVTAVVSGMLGTMTGFWLGSSLDSRKKTDILGGVK